MNAYLHNVLHEQARWAMHKDFEEIKKDEDYSFWVWAYISTPEDCRVNVGYVLS